MQKGLLKDPGQMGHVYIIYCLSRVETFPAPCKPNETVTFGRQVLGGESINLDGMPVYYTVFGQSSWCHNTVQHKRHAQTMIMAAVGSDIEEQKAVILHRQSTSTSWPSS